MPGHLTEQQAERYRQRLLSPAELLSIDDHIHRCEACRARLAAGEPLDAAWSAWAAAVSGEAEPPAIRTRFRRFLPAMAAAALVALVAAAVLLRTQSASTAPPVEKPPTQKTPRQEPPEIHGPLLAAPVIVLQDGNESLTLDREGRLSGLETLPAGRRRQVAAAIRTRRLEKPAVLAQLLGPPSSALRSPADPNEVEPLSPVSPVGTVVRANPPKFRWRPLPGAESYRVTVFDSDFHPVAESGSLRSSSWVPPAPLPDSRTLVWQVAARRDGEEITAPRPPTPEARFRILDPARAAEIDDAVRNRGGSHLLLAVLYADAGLVEEAIAELQDLEKLNKGSAVIGDLLRSLRSWQPVQSPSPSSTNPAQ